MSILKKCFYKLQLKQVVQNSLFYAHQETIDVSYLLFSWVVCSSVKVE